MVGDIEPHAVSDGLMAPAFAAGGMSLAGVIFGFFFLPESLPAEKRLHEHFQLGKANPFGVMFGIARLPTLSLLLVSNFLVNLAFSGMFTYMAVFTLDHFHASTADNAILFAVVGAVQMIGQRVIVYRLVPRFGEKKIAIFGLAIQVVSYSLFVIVPTFGWLDPLTVLGALGSAFCRPTLNALVANSVSDDQQGRAAGSAASLISRTNVIGPLLAGLAYDSLSISAPFIGGSVLMGIASVMIARLKPASWVAAVVEK